MSVSAKKAGSGKGSGPKKKVAAAPVVAPSHRTQDIAGVLVLAFGFLVVISLAVADRGVIGEALGWFFSILFGRGAWTVPPLAMMIGFMLLRGRGIAVSHLTWGLTLLFLTILGFLAQAYQGNYLDPTVVGKGGGYVGGMVAWLFSTLFGSLGKIVALIALGCVGFILCVDVPIRIMADNSARRAKALKAKTVDRTVERVREARTHRTERSASGQTQEDRVKPIREALAKAAMNMANADGTTRLLDPRTEEPAKEPVTREPVTRQVPRRGIVMEDPDPEPEVIARAVEMVEEPVRPKPVPPTPAPKPAAAAKSEFADDPVLSADLPTPKEGYQLPPANLLAEATNNPTRTRAEMQNNIETLEGTLEQFGIEATVVEVAAGPTVTRYEIQLGPGVRVARITALAENIAMDLAASQVRVEAPIPGKAAIGVEVPNETPSVVSLRELCDDPVFKNHPSRLFVALGKDVSGTNKYADLTKMPHLLIGGATNSGKSIGLATLITSLLMRNTPKDVRLVMIDPKRVELTLFDHIPHLMCPVIKDTKEAAGVLRAVWREMDRRYDLFSEEGVRNIDGWNAKASFQDRLPYIVVIIDELADLMIQHKAEVETVIVRLAQLARAVGIHMVLATQRPSVDVITGLIKANIPSRMAFSVASHIDSRTILDQKGAEALIGRGDMLFSPIDANKPIRVQGCYVSEKEIDQICKFWREQEKPAYVLQPIEAVDPADAKKEGGDFGDEVDPLWEDAVRWAVDRGQASTSMLQRKFAIGFQRASRLLDQMEERSIVGPRDGPRPREVLVGLLEVDDLFGNRPRTTDLYQDPEEA
jgi:S-DNA-T family DNA segregation ATPase FtsK/SpoIIIE